MSSLAPEKGENNQNSGNLSRVSAPEWVQTDLQTPHDLAIVIVGWNVADFLEQNLRSLAKSRGSFRASVVLVDNASKDDTVARTRALFPWVQVIANAENRGFAAACNQGIAATRSRHVLLLNPDMRIQEGALEQALAYVETHPDVGVFSGLLLQEDGSPLASVRRMPDIWSQWLILTKFAKVWPKALSRYLCEDLDLRKEQEVESVRGSFFFMTERVLRVLGGLDERYFIWYEEVDYCRNVREYGLRIMHVPSIIAHDAFGKSFAQRDSYWKLAQFSRSMVQYFTLWQPWWQATLLRGTRLAVLALARIWTLTKSV